MLKFIKTCVDEIEENLQYVGGTAGAVALTTAVAAATYYYSTRPVPEKPLVPLDNQCPIEAHMIHRYTDDVVTSVWWRRLVPHRALTGGVTCSALAGCHHHR
uniref:Uncharacterized protein n=1 Tax=Anopheles coluzzii TaxID=1518534 RepID=A0A8W7Q0E8_ANOCL